MEVSVIIPTFKGSNSISIALESLRKQTFKNFEVIIVDDNGEGTKEQQATECAVKNFEDELNIKYCIHKTNQNGAVARNTGLENSCGKYVAFLDDDDIYLNNRLFNAVQTLDAEKESDLLFCSVLIQRNGKFVEVIKPAYSEDIQKALIVNTSLFGTGSNIFLRRTVLEDVVGFDESYSRRQDNEFLLRALEKHSYTIIDALDIVKRNNGSANIPSYFKLVNANAKYFKDFAMCFNRLSESELAVYRENECARLFFCSLMNENYETKETAKAELNRYRKLKLKELVQFALSNVKIGKRNLLEIVQPQFSRLKHKRNHMLIINTIDKRIVEQIEQLKN